MCSISKHPSHLWLQVNRSGCNAAACILRVQMHPQSTPSTKGRGNSCPRHTHKCPGASRLGSDAAACAGSTPSTLSPALALTALPSAARAAARSSAESTRSSSLATESASADSARSAGIAAPPASQKPSLTTASTMPPAERWPSVLHPQTHAICWQRCGGAFTAGRGLAAAIWPKRLHHDCLMLYGKRSDCVCSAHSLGDHTACLKELAGCSGGVLASPHAQLDIETQRA